MTSDQLQPYRPEAQRRELPQPAGLDHTIDQFLFPVFRHKWLVAVFALLGIAAAGYLWLTTPVSYRSEARLMVRYIAENTGVDPAGISGRVTSPDSRGANIMQSEIGILTSRELIEKAVDELGAAKFLKGAKIDPVQQRGAAVLIASGNLKAQDAKNSNIIVASYDAPDPRLAQEVLSRITELYLQKHVEVHRAGVAFDFLSQQTDQMAARLAETEQELQLARAELGVSDVDKAKATGSARVDELANQLAGADTKLAGLQARVETLDSLRKRLESPSVVTGGPRAASGDPGLEASASAVLARLRSLREREGSLLTTYTEQSAPVQSIRREIAMAEEEWKVLSAGIPAAGQTVVTNQPAISALIADSLLNSRAELASLGAERTVVKQQHDEARQALAKLEAGEARVRKLQRRRDIEEANYLYFSKNLEQTRIDEALDSGKVTNISVVQKASSPLQGIRQEVAKRMGISVVLGLILGFGLAFVLENGVYTRWFVRPSDISKALGIPLLVSIPRLAGGTTVKQAPGKSSAAAGGGKAGAWTSPGDLVPYCERLHHRIMLSDVSAKKIPVIGVTGCSGGSGVSSIASGIAMSIARETEARVLVTTASLESGAEVFVDDQGRTTVVDWNRTVVPNDGDSGTLPEVSSPTRRFRELYAKIEDGSHRCVVLDLAPIHENGTALSIASSLDGVVLVLEAEKDRRAVARHCLELLREARVPVLGAVLNKYRRYAPRWLSDEV